MPKYRYDNITVKTGPWLLWFLDGTVLLFASHGLIGIDTERGSVFCNVVSVDDWLERTSHGVFAHSNPSFRRGFFRVY